MPERTDSKREARRRLTEAQDAWLVEVQRIADAAYEALVRACASQPVGVKVLERHGPRVDSDFFERGATCLFCDDPDSPYYDPTPESWPCTEARRIADALGHAITLADLPRYPKLDEFYDEPHVAITLAHPIAYRGKHHQPRDVVAVPLSVALRHRIRMTPESWQNVTTMEAR